MMNSKTMTKIMKISLKLLEGGVRKPEILKIVYLLHPSSAKDSVKLIAESGIEMYESLLLAIDKAGGSGWPMNTLLEMTVMDLLSNLATNRVRFVCTKDKK